MKQEDFFLYFFFGMTNCWYVGTRNEPSALRENPISAIKWKFQKIPRENTPNLIFLDAVFLFHACKISAE